jgi:YggT family protein
LIISVIASFIAQGSTHPALTLVHQIIEPICTPARKILPPMGGLDFSIILVFVSIHLVNILVIDNLRIMLGLGSGLILGI